MYVCIRPFLGGGEKLVGMSLEVEGSGEEVGGVGWW